MASVAPEVTTTLTHAVDLEAVEAAVVSGNGLAEFRHAGHGRVLVASVHQGIGGRAEDIRGTVGVGKALAEVDGLILDGEGGHHGEDRGAQSAQQRVDALHVRNSWSFTVRGR